MLRTRRALGNTKQTRNEKDKYPDAAVQGGLIFVKSK